MTTFTFDVKAFLTVRVTADTEHAARRQIDQWLPGVLEGIEVGEDVFVNAASLDGDHELIEKDGEPV